MFLVFLDIAPGAAEAWQPAAPDWTNGIIAAVVVLALTAACAWLLRRGSLGPLGRLVPLGRRRPRPVAAETVALLGDRRSLVVVTVEGRRLLLGLTPVSVALVAELSGADAFARSLDNLAVPREEKAS